MPCRFFAESSTSATWLLIGLLCLKKILHTTTGLVLFIHNVMPHRDAWCPSLFFFSLFASQGVVEVPRRRRKGSPSHGIPASAVAGQRVNAPLGTGAFHITVSRQPSYKHQAFTLGLHDLFGSDFGSWVFEELNAFSRGKLKPACQLVDVYMLVTLMRWW